MSDQNKEMPTLPGADTLANDIARHCRQFEQSDAYQEMLRKHVAALYETAIEGAFRWSDFSKTIRKALEESLPANISEMVDLPKYNLLLARTMAEQWETKAVGEQMVKQMQDLITNFVKEDSIPEFIKASELWQAYTESYAEEALHNGWESPHVVVSNDVGDGFFYVGLDKEPQGSSSSYLSRTVKDKPYQCEVYLGFHHVIDDRKQAVQHDGHDVYTLFAGQLDNSDALGKKPVQFRDKFEKLVGALYYGNSKLIDDMSAEDIYYPGHD